MQSINNSVQDDTAKSKKELISELKKLRQQMASSETVKRAERYPPEAIQLLQSSFDLLPEHIAILDEDGIILAVNQAWRHFADQNGFPEADYGIGTNYLDLCEQITGIKAREVQQVATGIRKVLHHQEEEFLLEYTVHTSQKQSWFEMRITRLIHKGITGLVIFHKEVTQYRLAQHSLQQSQKAIRRIYQITVNQQLDFNEKVQLLLKLGCQQLDMEFGVLSRIEDDYFEFEEVEAADTSLIKGDVYPIGETFCDITLIVDLEELPIALENITESEWATHPACTYTHFESYLGMPIFVQKEHYGTLFFASRQPKSLGFYGSDKEIIRLMAHWIGNELERRQSVEQLHYHSSLLHNVSDAIISTDLNLYIQSWNRAAEKLYGWPAREVLGRSIKEVLHTEFQGISRHEAFNRFAGTGGWRGLLNQQTKEGRQLTLQGAVSLIRDRSGTPTGVVIVNRDLTQYKQAEENFRNLLETAPDSMIIINQEGKIKFVNTQTQILFGYDPQELLDQPIEILLPDHFRSHYEQIVRRHSTDSAAPVMKIEDDLYGLRKDSYQFPIEISLSLLQTEQEIRIICAIRDITERKEAEQKIYKLNIELDRRVQERTAQLKAANRQKQNVLDAASEVSIIATDSEGVITLFNRGAEKMLGYSAEEVVGHHTPRLIHLKEEIEQQSEILSQKMEYPVTGFETFIVLAREEEASTQEWTYRRKDGSHLLVSLTVTAMRDIENQIIGYLGIAIDITERKQAEKTLRLQKTLLECQSETAPDGILMVDENRQWRYFNQRFVEMWPLPGEVVEQGSSHLAVNWLKHMVVEEDVFVAEIEYLYQQPEQKRRTEIHLKDGRILDRYTAPVKSEEGIYYGRIWYYRDITEQKKVEQEVRYLNEELEQRVKERTSELTSMNKTLQIEIAERRQTQEALQKAHQVLSFHIENSPLAVIEWDSQFRVKRWSKRAEEIFGWKAEEVMGKHPTEWKFIYQKDIKTVDNVLDNLLTGSKQRSVTQNRNYTKSGKVIYSAWYESALLDEQDNLVSVWSLVHDITERKQAEQALQQKSWEQKALLSSIPAIVYFKDKNLKYVAANPVFAATVGYSTDEVAGQTDHDFFSPEKALAHQKSDLQVIESGKPLLNVEERATWTEWVTTSKVPYFDDKGNVIGLVGTSFDITDRKRVEQALRESEHRYRTIISGLSVIIFTTDMAGNYLFSDGKGLEAIGRRPGQNIGRSIFEVYQDNPEGLAAFQKAFKGQQALWTDVIAERIFETRLTPMYDIEGSQSGVIGLAIDITERKQAEEALRESEERYRTLASNIPNCDLYLFDRELRFLIAEGTEFKRLGFRRTDFEGKRLSEVLRSENLPRMEKLYRKALKGQKASLEVSYGSSIYYIQVTPIRNSQGEIYAGMVLSQNITERKQAENALRASEEQFRVMFENAGLGILLTDEASYSFKSNPAFRKMFGYNDTELKKLRFIDLIHPDEVETHRQLFGQLLTNKQDEYQIEGRFQHQKGHYFWGRLTTTLIRDMDDQFRFALDMIEDISARKEGERILRESEERLRLVVQNMPVLMDAFDDQGNIVVWNRECERVSGYKAEEIIGNPKAMELLYPDPVYLEEMQIWWNKMGDNYRNWEWNITCKDGTVKTISWSNISSELPIPGWASWGIGFDVTERKRAEAALRNQTEELARSNAELEQFAYVASHDLQEPLRMVTSYVKLLERRYKGQLDDKADKFIIYAVDGANRMQALIMDLLQISRVNSQARPFEWTDCEKVVKEVLTDLRLAIKQSQAKITTDPLPTLMADSLQLNQVFQNLISNAIKFQEDKPPQIHISAKREEKQWKFSIQDNGIGIKAEQQDRIFVIFKRLHSRAKYPGNGIGLSICKKIIERHGGQIWVESEVKKGTTFHFTISDNINHMN